ncbi:G1 family glutamic endopeptidase [Streptomyces olivochromogenes]|nr:G1 family glutamic endopeptidase [Streptomyces olivochromogenes]
MSTYKAPFEMDQVYRYTIPPRLNSIIRIRTLPNACCVINDADDGNPLLVQYSDPDGFLAFDICPAGESVEIARLSVDAKTDGESVQHALKFHFSNKPNDKYPLPPAQYRSPPRRDERIRPGLELSECLSLQDDELLARGYPTRPDPELTPSAFDTWLRIVSNPIAFIEPHLVARSDVAGAPRPLGDPVNRDFIDTDNWSGFQAEAPAGTYVQVFGQWQVPEVSGAILSPKAYSGLWVGLGEGVLVQAGTAQECIVKLVHEPSVIVPVTLSTYNAWTQFRPIQPTAQLITNFPIRPGDVILGDVWIADKDPDIGPPPSLIPPPSLSGTHVWFQLINVTTMKSTRVLIPRGSVAVPGAQAEWIMERPQVRGGSPPLANYGTATMGVAAARRADGRYVLYRDANVTSITMISHHSGHEMSSVAVVDKSTMRFKWHAFE